MLRNTICAASNTRLWICLFLMIVLAGCTTSDQRIASFQKRVEESIARGNKWYVTPGGTTVVVTGDGNMAPIPNN